MLPSAPIQFADGNLSRVIHVARETPLPLIVSALEIPPPHSLLIVNGGTSQLEPELYQQLGLLMEDGLARVSAEERLTLITGGTNMGVFALLGHGLAKWGRTAPCIGVVVDQLIRWPGTPPAWFPNAQPAELAPLETHHSHFVLVEGSEWGDETQTMSALCATLGEGIPSLMVIANGGNVLRKEVLNNVRQGREILVITESGRFADELAAVVRGEAQPANADIAEIAGDGRITLFDLRQKPAEFADLVRHLLHLS